MTRGPEIELPTKLPTQKPLVLKPLRSLHAPVGADEESSEQRTGIRPAKSADNDTASDPVGNGLRFARKTVVFGFAVIVLFFGGLVGWAAYAPLESAAVAPGSIAIDTNRKAVQHLEGGIITQILVRERDTVSAGQALVVLDETPARTKVANLEAQIGADERQLKLVRQEEDLLEGLTKKGLVQLPRLLQVTRRRVELEGSLAQSKSQLAAAKELLARTTIRSPISGTVVGLQVHTTGGVVAAGATIMEVVPTGDPLVVEVRIDTNDIDVVQEGLTAFVRLTPFNYRNASPVPGRVAWVSADRMSDQRSGQVFYLARIKLDALPARIGPANATLYPGMPVEAMIVTGKRTALDYMIGPIVNSFNRAFRED
jgi:multidrug efflux pump subunit AcrA (membrane-fusion protein)